MAKAPGKACREGVSVLELAEIFPTDKEAREWFERHRWPDGRYCPHCGSMNTVENGGKSESRPYRCRDCKRHFSVRKGTVMEGSPLPLRKWVWAIYLHLTSLKGVSSMKLHRDLGVTQKTAWFMLQRIREAFKRDDDEPPMDGPVEVDEVYPGGLRKNMSNAKRKMLEGRGAVGKDIVVGVKDRKTNEVRARHVQNADTPPPAGFAARNARLGTKVYSDEARVYPALSAWYGHESVNHSVGEYVRQQAHTNGMESFWAGLRRAHNGVYHKFSPKHLHRCIAEFSGRHNIREAGTLAQMAGMVSGMVGKRLTYARPSAGNGLASGARAA